jgi:transposase
MSKYKSYNPHQLFLLPPSLNEWLPKDHLVYFLLDVVSECFDLSEFGVNRRKRQGQPAYHPQMMVALLLYAYMKGRPSSRKIEEATYTDVAFRILAANQHPDHDTIATFRKTHLKALANLFSQILRICDRAGLVTLESVSIDGTKIEANASKHKAMSYKRMCETEEKLENEIVELLRKAVELDQEEDEKFGKGKNEFDLPAELKRREDRLKKIGEAKQALEEEAREKARELAAEARATIAARRKMEEEMGYKTGWQDPHIPDPDIAKPDPKAQKSFTDPESRIMKDGATKEFIQAYNAQAVVDRKTRIIVAADVTDEGNDYKQLVPMLNQAEANMGSKPAVALADTGYFSAENVADPSLEGIDLYVAVGRKKHGEEDPVTEGEVAENATAENATAENATAENATAENATAEGKAAKAKRPMGKAAKTKAAKETMQGKLRTKEGKAIYAERKWIVEPVFGLIKAVMGFRRFSFRGKENVRQEWKIVSLAHDMLKLYRSGICVKGLAQGVVALKAA